MFSILWRSDTKERDECARIDNLTPNTSGIYTSNIYIVCLARLDRCTLF
jgi:hypothetical protein